MAKRIGPCTWIRDSMISLPNTVGLALLPSLHMKSMASPPDPYACVCKSDAHSGVPAQVRVCIWRPKFNLRCLPHSLSILFFGKKVFHEPCACWFEQTGWLANPVIHTSPPVSAEFTGMHRHAWLLKCGFWGSNICPVSTSLPEPSL